MTLFDDAVQADIAGDVVRATELYEANLRSRGNSIDDYVNLAILYWQCTDYGFFTVYRLTTSFRDLADARWSMLLKNAREKFPASVEIRFWQMYCDYISRDGSDPSDEIGGLNVEATDSSVPYFFLYARSNGYEYKMQAMNLLSACELLPTTKNRYIASVIRAVMARTG